MKIDKDEIAVVLHNRVVKMFDAQYEYASSLVDHMLRMCDYDNLYRFYTNPDELVRYVSLLNEHQGEVMDVSVFHANNEYTRLIKEGMVK